MVAEVNASPAALAARIELNAIRWENLPPGETVERDYQGRIDDLMTRAGLDRFEIYLLIAVANVEISGAKRAARIAGAIDI